MRDPESQGTGGAPSSREFVLTAEELAAAAGITHAWLVRLIRVGVVEPIEPGSSEFAVAAAVRLRKILRLRADLGISWVGASIVADLLERVDLLERALARRESESGL